MSEQQVRTGTCPAEPGSGAVGESRRPGADLLTTAHVEGPERGGLEVGRHDEVVHAIAVDVMDRSRPVRTRQGGNGELCQPLKGSSPEHLYGRSARCEGRHVRLLVKATRVKLPAKALWMTPFKRSSSPVEHQPGQAADDDNLQGCIIVQLQGGERAARGLRHGVRAFHFPRRVIENPDCGRRRVGVEIDKLLIAITVDVGQ